MMLSEAMMLAGKDCAVGFRRQGWPYEVHMVISYITGKMHMCRDGYEDAGFYYPTEADVSSCDWQLCSRYRGGMSFEAAYLSMIKEGKKVRRHGCPIYLEYLPDEQGIIAVYEELLKDGEHYRDIYVPSRDDIIAHDWEVYEEASP